MTKNLRRLAAVSVAMLAALGTTAIPASAADNDIRAWVGAPDFDYPYLMERGRAFEPTFGLIGVPDTLDVTFSMDLSELHANQVGFEFLGAEGCQLNGKVATCTSPRLPGWIGPSTGERMSSSVRIRALGNAPIGFAGNLIVRAETARNTFRQPVYIVQPALGADLATATTSTIKGKVGDVISTKFTIRNLGPNVLPDLGIVDPHMPKHATFVKFGGCQPGTVNGFRVNCAIRTPLEVGDSVTITVTIRITALDTGGSPAQIGLWIHRAFSDPNPRNDEQAELIVTGSSRQPSNGTASTAETQTAAGAAKVSASPSTPVVLDALDAPDPTQELKLTAERAAADTRSVWPIVTALLVALLLGGLGISIRRRRA